MSEQKAICPFCGRKPKTAIEEQISGIWKATASCEPCALTMQAFGRTRDEARERLNRRWNARYEWTCHVVESRRSWDGDLWEVAFSCGHEHLVPPEELPLGYCSECGAKVVDDE